MDGKVSPDVLSSCCSDVRTVWTETHRCGRRRMLQSSLTVRSIRSADSHDGGRADDWRHFQRTDRKREHVIRVSSLCWQQEAVLHYSVTITRIYRNLVFIISTVDLWKMLLFAHHIIEYIIYIVEYLYTRRIHGIMDFFTVNTLMLLQM